MNNSIKFAIVIFFFLILIFNFSLLRDSSNCSFVQSVNASIAVQEGYRRIIGLNADTDSLRFGIASPQAVVRRTLYVNNANDAKVNVFMEGDFSDWVTIKPSEFDLKANKVQEVNFAVKVPDYPNDSDYTGKAVFCFKE